MYKCVNQNVKQSTMNPNCGENWKIKMQPVKYEFIWTYPLYHYKYRNYCVDLSLRLFTNVNKCVIKTIAISRNAAYKKIYKKFICVFLFSDTYHFSHKEHCKHLQMYNCLPFLLKFNYTHYGLMNDTIKVKK